MTKEEIEHEKLWTEGIVSAVMLSSKGIVSDFISNLEKVGYKIVKAESENERLKAEREWISVKEQKPLTDEIIHVWHRNELKKCKRCIVGNNELWHYEGESRLSYEAPTHWMPLPQSPKQSCPQCKTEYTKEELLTNEHCFKCGFEMKGF